MLWIMYIVMNVEGSCLIANQVLLCLTCVSQASADVFWGAWIIAGYPQFTLVHHWQWRELHLLHLNSRWSGPMVGCWEGVCLGCEPRIPHSVEHTWSTERPKWERFRESKLAYYVQHHVPPFGLDVPDVSWFLMISPLIMDAASWFGVFVWQVYGRAPGKLGFDVSSRIGCGDWWSGVDQLWGSLVDLSMLDTQNAHAVLAVQWMLFNVCFLSCSLCRKPRLWMHDVKCHDI